MELQQGWGQRREGRNSRQVAPLKPPKPWGRQRGWNWMGQGLGVYERRGR